MKAEEFKHTKEIEILEDDGIILSRSRKKLKGYKLKGEVNCIDQDGKSFKQFIYEKS